MLRAGELAPAVDLLGAVALLLVTTTLAFRAPLAGAALFVLGAEYVLVEATGRAPAASVIAYGVGLLLCAELLLWAGELPSAAVADRALVAERLASLAVLVSGAAVLGLVALAGSGVRLPGAFAAALVGTTAAIVLLALPLALLRGLRRR
jgi:hypothetical protein